MSKDIKPKRICNGTLIFRRFRRNPKTGKEMDAWDYGLKAWPICIGEWEVKEKAEV